MKLPERIVVCRLAGTVLIVAALLQASRMLMAGAVPPIAWEWPVVIWEFALGTCLIALPLNPVVHGAGIMTFAAYTAYQLLNVQTGRTVCDCLGWPLLPTSAVLAIAGLLMSLLTLLWPWHGTREIVGGGVAARLVARISAW